MSVNPREAEVGEGGTRAEQEKLGKCGGGGCRERSQINSRAF